MASVETPATRKPCSGVESIRAIRRFIRPGATA